MLGDKVKKIIFNWLYSHELGEDYSYYEVGKNNVTDIRYHKASFEGDRHHCIIYFSNKEKEVIFNLNCVEY